MAAQLEEERRGDDMPDPSPDHGVDRVGDAGPIELQKADHHSGVAPAPAYLPRHSVDRLVGAGRWAAMGHDQQAGAMAGVERPPTSLIIERAQDVGLRAMWVRRAVVDLQRPLEQ